MIYYLKYCYEPLGEEVCMANVSLPPQKILVYCIFKKMDYMYSLCVRPKQCCWKEFRVKK